MRSTEVWEELQSLATVLERANARYAAFFEYSPDACAITDAAGTVREVNQALLELLKASREQALGRPLSELVAAAAVPCERSARPIALKASGVAGVCWLIRPESDR